MIQIDGINMVEILEVINDDLDMIYSESRKYSKRNVKFYYNILTKRLTLKRTVGFTIMPTKINNTYSREEILDEFKKSYTRYNQVILNNKIGYQTMVDCLVSFEDIKPEFRKEYLVSRMNQLSFEEFKFVFDENLKRFNTEIGDFLTEDSKLFLSDSKIIKYIIESLELKFTGDITKDLNYKFIKNPFVLENYLSILKNTDQKCLDLYFELLPKTNFSDSKYSRIIEVIKKYTDHKILVRTNTDLMNISDTVDTVELMTYRDGVSGLGIISAISKTRKKNISVREIRLPEDALIAYKKYSEALNEYNNIFNEKLRTDNQIKSKRNFTLSSHNRDEKNLGYVVYIELI